MFRIGNTLYECNNWAGGMAAIYSLPGAENTHGLRIGCCIAYGVIVLAILFADKVNSLGVALGLVMVGMVILFLVVVIRLGLDGERFAKGLIPIEMPSGSANIVLSLIGTTAIGFNLFLGGAMAEGKSLPEAQRGIAFSTVMTLIVSVLIMIIGDGTHLQSKGEFTIASLAGIIERLTGDVGLWIFGIGFIAAAISSMLTVPLGAALTAESVFTINEPIDNVVNVTGMKSETKTGGDMNNSIVTKGDNNKRSEIAATKSTDGLFGKEKEPYRPFPKRLKFGPMVLMVTIAVIVISADAPTVKVILIAQVSCKKGEGFLLLFFECQFSK